MKRANKPKLIFSVYYEIHVSIAYILHLLNKISKKKHESVKIKLLLIGQKATTIDKKFSPLTTFHQ